MSKWISVGVGPVRFGSSINGPSQSSPMGCGGIAGSLIVGLVLLPFIVPWQYTAAVYGTIAVIALALYIKVQSYRRKVELERERRRIEAEERKLQRQLEAEERELQRNREAAARKQAREDQLQQMRNAAASKKKLRAEQRQAWVEARKSSVPRQRPRTEKPDTAHHAAATQAAFIDRAKTIRSKLRRDRTISAED